jgi:hypothetical protein
MRYDFALDSNDDLAINAQGDFYFEPSDQDHIQDTINAWPGWWKQYPLDGVAVLSYLKSSSGQQLLARQIKVELNSDGYQVNNPVIAYGTDGSLTITPNATIV